MTRPTARLFVHEDHDEILTASFLGGEVAVFSRRAPHKESGNEDAVALLEAGGRGVLVVADGCGGMQAGDEASRILVDALRRSVGKVDGHPDSLRAAILDGLEAANRKVLRIGVGAATTAVVVEVGPRGARFYHAGDSQALLVSQRGQVKLRTLAHSPVGYAIEAGVLSDEEAIHHEDRHIVSNVIGGRDTHIQLGLRRKLATRDTVVLASDGLFDNLFQEEIVGIVRKGSLARAARNLRKLAEARMRGEFEDFVGKPDDLSLVVYRPGGSARKAPSPGPARGG